MPRQRMPLAKAEVTGAAVVHAGRFKDRKAPKGTRPLGQPYAGMTEAQQTVWEEFRDELPWLNSSHRRLLRVACILSARLDDPAIGVNQLQTLSAVLSKLGATPVDETKVSVPDGDDSDPADAFFGRPN